MRHHDVPEPVRLRAVYSELLDFEGCEIYTMEQPELTGNSFADAVMAYESSTLIGLANAWIISRSSGGISLQHETEQRRCVHIRLGREAVHDSRHIPADEDGVYAEQGHVEQYRH